MVVTGNMLAQYKEVFLRERAVQYLDRQAWKGINLHTVISQEAMLKNSVLRG